MREDTRREVAPRPCRTQRAAAAAALAAALGLGVAVTGFLDAGADQAALAAAIRDTSARNDAGFPLARPLVGGRPVWTLPGHNPADRSLQVRLDDVPLDTGGTATVTVDAAAARWDRDAGLLHVTDATIALELGADALGRPFGLTGSYLTAFDDGSLAGAPEDRARLSGRTAGSSGVPAETVAWTLRLRLDAGRAAVVIQEPDHSTAGTALVEGLPSRDQSHPIPDGPPAARPGDALVIDASAMPLGARPNGVFAHARTLTVTAHLERASFPPAELAQPLRFHRETDAH